MHQFHNFGPLFLVEAGVHHETDRLIFTCSTFEHALDRAGAHMAAPGSDYDDVVRVRAVQPGPGPGVVVARWFSRHPPLDVFPCDGEGPPSASPVPTWDRVL